MNNVAHKIPVREYRSVENGSIRGTCIPLGMQPFIVGRIPNGMRSIVAFFFSTERYSLTGIWTFLLCSYSTISALTKRPKLYVSFVFNLFHSVEYLCY